MANPTPTPKRIPKGTRVRWRARYPSDPLHDGEVLAFVDKGALWPKCAERDFRNLGPSARTPRHRAASSAEWAASRWTTSKT